MIAARRPGDPPDGRPADLRRRPGRRPQARRGGGAHARSCATTPSTRPPAARCWSRPSACSAPARSRSAAPTTACAGSRAEQRAVGVVAFSSGNHAQGVAAAARLLDCPPTIVMPADAPGGEGRGHPRLRRRGGLLRPLHRVPRSHRRRAGRRARAPSWCRPTTTSTSWPGRGPSAWRRPSSSPRWASTADLLVTPGVGRRPDGRHRAGLRRAVARAPQLYVAEPAGYEDHAPEPEGGRPTPITPPGPSISDALLAPQPGDLTFAINGNRLAGAVAATDEEALAAMAIAFRHLKLVLEPAAPSPWPPCSAAGCAGRPRPSSSSPPAATSTRRSTAKRSSAELIGAGPAGMPGGRAGRHDRPA